MVDTGRHGSISARNSTMEETIMEKFGSRSKQMLMVIGKIQSQTLGVWCVGRLKKYARTELLKLSLVKSRFFFSDFFFFIQSWTDAFIKY